MASDRFTPEYGQFSSTGGNSAPNDKPSEMNSQKYMELIAELESLRERLADLEDLEVQRITEERERFDSLNVLDEYAQQLEESRDKLARLLRAGVGIEEARTASSILQTVADAVGAAGWASAVVYLFDNFEIVEAAYHGVCDEDIRELTRNRRPPEERARLFAPQFDEFKISKSYFVPAQRLHEVIHSRYVVPGRRESMPGDDWDPMDLVYVPMYSSTGKVLGTINCDDPINGKRPTAEVFQYLEIFSDLAARKIETVKLLDRQAEIELQLRESEEKYRTIFDRSADGFFLMDDLFRECNDAALKLFACELDDIIGHAPAEFSPKFQPSGQRSDKLAAEHINHARNGTPQNFEWVHRRKDGAELNCEVSLAAIEVSGRAMIMAIVRDVTDRKRSAHDKETTAIASQLFLSARSMDLVYSQLPKILTSRFPFEVAAVELYDAVTDELVLVGEERTGITLGTRFAATMTVSGTVVRTGDTIVDVQTGRRPDYAHADLRRLGLQRLVCAPLRVRDQVVGVVWMGNTQQATNVERAAIELSQAAIPLNIVANYLAQAIDRQRAEEELFDLKQFFENLLDNLPAQVAVYGVDGNYKYANRACIPDDNLREWAVGNNDESLARRLGSNSDIGAQRRKAIGDALAQKHHVRFEERLRDSSDRERYFLRAISPVTNPNGQIDYVIGYGLDITDTKLWEQEQRLLYQLPTDNPFPVVACGANGNILYMNQAAESLSRESSDNSGSAILPKDHLQAIDELMRRPDDRVERTAIVGAVTIRWVYSSASGGRIHMFGMEVPAESPHNRSRSNTPQLLNDVLAGKLSTPVWLLDLAGNIISSSQAAKDILLSHGVENVRSLIEDEYWTRILSIRGASGEPEQHETQVKSRAWKWTASPVTEQIRLLELTDVTEVRELQDKLRHAQKLEAVGRLAGGIAHDFNNLLTAIIGNLELLENAQCGPDHSRDCAREAAKAAERASVLVKQLLNYSRKSSHEPRAIDPNSVCNSVVRMLARTVDRKIAVEEDLQSNVWAVSADPNQIEQILMNLGVNSADAIMERFATASPEGEPPSIRIKTENVPSHTFTKRPQRRGVEDCVAISVSDNGTGMSPQIQKRIFDAFFTTKAENRGTGLGLSIVIELVEALGGEIVVQSQIGKGSTFTIYLPRTGVPVADAPLETVFATSRGGSEVVLLVDDEPVIIDLGLEVLEQAGYTVLIARDGREAVKVFEENIDAIDLVIMDISLPVMSGDEAVSIMLSEKDHLPIILSSGLPDMSSERRKVSLGSVAFIQKPYRPSELLGAVREVLDHANP